MSTKNEFGFRVKNYKCFGDDFTGFDEIKPINIIIGTNNSGKSALLDVVDYFSDSDNWFKKYNISNRTELLIEVVNDHDANMNAFRETYNRINIRNFNYHYVESLENEKVSILVKNGKKTIPKSHTQYEDSLSPHFNSLANILKIPYVGRNVLRLKAERKIEPEIWGKLNEGLVLASSGIGATNIIQSFLNNANMPHGLVNGEFKDKLNSIIAPDAVFASIDAFRIDDDSRWEISLQEKEKGLIPLSSSGSGLQTLILVLIATVLIPKIENKAPSDYIFVFEELENNLHPSLQRRLFQYLLDFIQKNNYEPILFLSTHSSIGLDSFANNEYSQIIGVRHENGISTTKTITRYSECRAVLEELGYRASDLLQTNCVIWVEGPSDRIYFNKWVDLWTEGTLKEGLDYTCVFYGGRLLSNISYDDHAQEKRIKALFVNPHAIVIMDSDKKKKADSINKTKQRIMDEIKAIDGYAWITDGKEIENYIPSAAIAAVKMINDQRKIGQYKDIVNFLNNWEPGWGDKYKSDKISFAREIVPNLAKIDLMKMYDFAEHMDMVVSKIKQWNGKD